MLCLANSELTIDLLDPIADRARFGPRFCAGGYVWQVHDVRAGPLLTGPEWPEPAPAPHNGQGLPESFRHSTTAGEPLLWSGPVGLAPGAGVLARTADGQVVLAEPCAWRIDRGDDRVVFATAQRVGPWDYELERDVRLRGRTLVSTSTLTNRAPQLLRLEWFAHPFFALDHGRARIQVPTGTALPDNPGYLLSGDTVSFRRAFHGPHDGHLDHLSLPPGTPLSAAISHPRVREVRFATDFAPFKCVLWANGHTVSLEPFLVLCLAPGATQRWELRYEFGEPEI